MDKRNVQLGMNYSTAAHRLRTDILYAFAIAAGHRCHRCSKALTRDTFSIEHKVSWLDSEDPLKLYFDLDNIAFSHQSCNYSAGGKGRPKQFSDEERAVRDRESKRRYWTPEKRREHYLKTGN